MEMTAFDDVMREDGLDMRRLEVQGRKWKVGCGRLKWKVEGEGRERFRYSWDFRAQSFTHTVVCLNFSWLLLSFSFNNFSMPVNGWGRSVTFFQIRELTLPIRVHSHNRPPRKFSHLSPSAADSQMQPESPHRPLLRRATSFEALFTPFRMAATPSKNVALCSTRNDDDTVTYVSNVTYFSPQGELRFYCFPHTRSLIHLLGAGVNLGSRLVRPQLPDPELHKRLWKHWLNRNWTKKTSGPFEVRLPAWLPFGRFVVGNDGHDLQKINQIIRPYLILSWTYLADGVTPESIVVGFKHEAQIQKDLAFDFAKVTQLIHLHRKVEDWMQQIKVGRVVPLYAYLEYEALVARSAVALESKLSYRLWLLGQDKEEDRLISLADE